MYSCACRGAGTDANVSIEIHGDKAFVGATKLDNAHNNFEVRLHPAPHLTPLTLNPMCPPPLWPPFFIPPSSHGHL